MCKPCWNTTETFHELYLKSKSVQEKYLNSLIKIEQMTDAAGDVWQNQKENSIFCDELQIDIKPEINMDDTHSLDFQMDYNGLDGGESSEASENEEHGVEHGDEHDKNQREEQAKQDKTDIGSGQNVNLKRRSNNKTIQSVAREC